VRLAPGCSHPAAARLLAGLPAAPAPPIVVLASGPRDAELDWLAGWLGARQAEAARVLVISALGAHPDARAPRLRALWRIEELARASGLPVLVLRLAPLLGPASPLWLRLRSRPRLPRGGRPLLCPVAEADARQVLRRALAGAAAWEGWFEIAGAEPLTLLELAELARAVGPALAAGAGDWEPAAEEMEEQRLPDIGPWTTHFGFRPQSLRERAPEWT
jgi:uncharacterized protein YbjT (DUF2867 family)